MKKILIVSGLALAISFAAATQNVYAGKIKAPVTVNARAQTELALYFPEASSVRWVEKSQILTAYFTGENGKGVAQFDKKGRLARTVIYHQDTDLPVNISMDLKKEYKGYSVQNVVEYTDTNSHYYFVLLTSSDGIVRVRMADDGQSSVLEQLKKA